ncbi:hypothetical protein NC653_041327 [Populus alba x Populus x berolinensis]|uniref:Uncharacterized protein n=1 Tax=Populus alba x Populus x berolinensis TaxID=444605 RepID=A0AAD6PP23_9ROSI|nr:hypothetical protein NC653_041327 [Populus alba x Populus x berolinensis]
MHDLQGDHDMKNQVKGGNIHGQQKKRRGYGKPKRMASRCCPCVAVSSIARRIGRCLAFDWMTTDISMTTTSISIPSEFVSFSFLKRHEGEREEKEKVWRLYKRSVESGGAEHLGLRGIKVTREGSMLYIIGIRLFMDLESCYSFIAAFLSQLIE